MKSLGSVGATAREARLTLKLPTTASHTCWALMGRREPPMVTNRAQRRVASAQSMDSEQGTLLSWPPRSHLLCRLLDLDVELLLLKQR
jgi:hypothetical protein